MAVRSNKMGDMADNLGKLTAAVAGVKKLVTELGGFDNEYCEEKDVKGQLNLFEAAAAQFAEYCTTVKAIKVRP